MKNEHVAILIEELKDSIRGVADGVSLNSERLDRMEANTNERFDRVDQRLDRVDQRLDRVETALLDLRSIASNHEARLQ